MRNAIKCLAGMTLMTLCTLPVSTVQAKPLFSKTFSYFAIQGVTAEDLDRELASKGPLVKSTGSRHPGETQIKFGGSAKYLEKGGSCRVQDAQVTVQSKIFLPTWKNRKHATPQLAMIWDALSSDIRRHEERHAEIARQHGAQLELTLKSLSPEKTCETMRKVVAATTDRAVQAHDEDQIRFDRTEAINFEQRLARLIDARTQSVSKQK